MQSVKSRVCARKITQKSWTNLMDFSGLAMYRTVSDAIYYVAGFVVPGICLVSTGYVDCNATLAVFLITAAVGFSGVAFAGFMVNHLDLAPPYAGLHLLPSEALELLSISICEFV